METMSRALAKARAYEEQAEKMIPPESRPGFHLSPRAGWLNDPNGFSRYGGEYHLFYQYHPYSSQWGPMHWGHAVSGDLLRWRFLPAALAPEEPYDRDGCFSGGAVTLQDGRHLLMYTGVDRSSGRDVQTQNLAVGDGVNYVKYAKNPVLTAADLPEGCSPADFRDPKLWQEPDGSYRMVAVNRAADGFGQVLLFRSGDGLRWERAGTVCANRGRLGQMWECPDLFQLDGQDVLLCSAMDMLPRKLEYPSGNVPFYALGKLDRATGEFAAGPDHAVDQGIDFYAPQTVLTEDGRRVMIAWMQNWDTVALRTDPRPWFGQMTLPRELSVREGRLFQVPVRELEELRRDAVVQNGVPLSREPLRLPGVAGRMADIELDLRPKNGGFGRFTLHFAEKEKLHTTLRFLPGENVVQLDRRYSGSRRAIVHQCRARVSGRNGALRLRLVLDRCSAEVFLNDGETALTATLYTDARADGISFSADGAAEMDLRFYRLDPEAG